MEHVFAQTLQLPGTTPILVNGPAGFSAGNTLGEVLSRAIPLLLVFGGIGLLLMLILGGFQVLTGGSDPKNLESGKQRITYAIVGFIIIFTAFWMVQFIAIMFGLKEFKCVFGLGGPCS